MRMSTLRGDCRVVYPRLLSRFAAETHLGAGGGEEWGRRGGRRGRLALEKERRRAQEGEAESSRRRGGELKKERQRAQEGEAESSRRRGRELKKERQRA
jgi:hypothetical protein